MNDVKNTWNKTYYVYNDEILSLISMWKKSSNKSMYEEKIIDKMGFMIYNRISYYKNTSLYEDLLQEGRIGILKAMEKFDITRGCNFFQYSTFHIKNQIRLYLQKHRKNKEILTNNIIEGVGEDDPISLFEKQEARKILLSAIDTLPDIDQNIIKMRFGLDNSPGKTYQQIGDVFSLSKQRIEQITSRAVSRLRKNKQLNDFFNEVET
jgi:RNA polymerase sporulation-specific sigma factor